MGGNFDFRRTTVFCLGYCVSKHKMTRYATHFEGIGPWDPLAMRILPPVYLHEFLKMYVLQHLRCMEELHTRSNSPFNCQTHQRRILQRRRNDFDLSMCEIELFIALQYVRGLYGTNHSLHFHYNETYDIPIFSEKISCLRLIAVLKYLSFGDNPYRRCTAPGTDRFTPILVVFQTLASMCKWKYYYSEIFRWQWASSWCFRSYVVQNIE